MGFNSGFKGLISNQHCDRNCDGDDRGRWTGTRPST